ncbi:phosphotransferase family protein [Calidifontibacillus oryziterrae]|uniref:phosphotransferase family protein n=1 Tax=Calidifontibacillus oryziterrae TaxID=1191699 RepID=UPI000475904C|nr:phosphotransferase family protein [Calidifontibacillus oryziterrae]
MSLGLGEGWRVFPAGGATGEAYIAQYEGRNKLFLKRNSSPFLAVLSAEGIVPKLIWTKRMENGDVITAQHWLNGRELKPVDMNNKAVAHLLSKIHHSKELLYMLQRIGKIRYEPSELLTELKRKTKPTMTCETVIADSLAYLENELPNIYYDNQVVCHCDVNHNNWLLTNEQELFLIDWDGAAIADPALDLGSILYGYIPRHDWETWLKCYGIELTENLERRMKWYIIYQTLLSGIWYKGRGDSSKYRRQIHYLERIYK